MDELNLSRRERYSTPKMTYKEDKFWPQLKKYRVLYYDISISIY